MRVTARLLATSAVCLSLLHTPAVFAQDGPDPADGPDDETVSLANVDNNASPVIVVTATKQAQSLQDAPAAITVIDSEELTARGFTGVRDLSDLVPSARFNIEGNAVQVFIRGVGSALDNPYIAESVGTQVDGVYFPRSATPSGLFDLERIEVLPGPQGTLYGRAAIGGVVSISTRRPGSEFGANGFVEVGNYETVHVSGGVDIPLSESVRTRLALDFNHHNGFNNNGTDDLETFGGRLSVEADASDNLSIFLWGSYFQNRNQTSPLLYTPGFPGDIRDLPEFDPTTAFLYPPNGYPNDLGFNRYRTYAFGGQIDLELGDVTASYIPGYVNTHERQLRIINGFPQNPRIDGEQITNELRFSNTDPSRFEWLLGLYQFHNSNPYYYTFGTVVEPFPGYPAGSGTRLAGNDLTSETSAYAIYGQGTYSVSDSFRITLGGRYSWERLTTDDAQTFIPFDPVTFGPCECAVSFDYRQSWESFDWKVGFEADIGPDSLLYGNVQTGFNPGTFVVDFPNHGGTFLPQEMVGYTLGVKNTFADGAVQANLELFYYDYTDQLIQNFDGATSAFLIFNVPESRMFGVQLDTAFELSPWTRFTVNAAYLNAELSEFTFNGRDLSGFQIPFSPSFTLIAGFEHSFPLSSGASIDFRLNSTFNSGYWETIDHLPTVLRQEAYTRTDLNLSYVFPDDRFEIGAWVRNIENEDVHAASAPTGKPAPFTGVVYLEPPRTYGLRFRAAF